MKVARYMSCKTKIKYNTIKNDFDIKIKDQIIEYEYYKNDTQYIQLFIEQLKSKIIRKLPNLNKVNINLGVYDKNNIFHQIVLKTFHLLCDIFKIIHEIKVEKTIFVLIYYDNELVYHGSIEFI